MFLLPAPNVIQELRDLTIPDKQNCLTPESIPTWSDAIPKRGFFHDILAFIEDQSTP